MAKKVYVVHETRDGAFSHYGVKGMRWGVRKARAKASSIKKTADKNYEKNKAADVANLRKLKFNKLANAVEKAPKGGYELAAAKKVGSMAKTSVKKTKNWAKENPVKAELAAAALIFAASAGLRVAGNVSQRRYEAKIMSDLAPFFEPSVIEL